MFLADEQATRAFAESLVPRIKPGMVIFLEGDLGAGKTTLVRALLHALGYTGLVKSPTYTLVESYPFAGYKVHHFDLYRLADPEELEYMGFNDYLAADSVCLIEWPEKGVGWLPKPDLCLKIDILQQGRQIAVI